MSFFQRVVSHLFNQVLVDGLANSKLFQRGAVALNQSLKEVHKHGTEAAKQAGQVSKTFTKELEKEMAKMNAEAAKKAGGPPKS